MPTHHILGRRKKHYSHDPLCAEVDHAALIEQLAEYDGWALSMSAAMYSLKEIIALAPDDCRVAAWVKPFASFKKGCRSCLYVGADFI